MAAVYYNGFKLSNEVQAMMISKQELIDALPQQMRKGMNDATYATLAQALSDPDELQRFKENFISFSTALKDGKYSVQQYIDAVKYVSFKKMGLTNLESFRRTFPAKIKRYAAEGKSDACINSFVSGYNQTKIVTRIFDQSMIPVHVLNQDAVQTAINALVKTIRTSKNDVAVVKAADSLLNHLKPPVETKVSLDIGVKETPMLSELREESARLARQQQQMIESGMYTARQIAEMKVIEGEAVHVGN